MRATVWPSFSARRALTCAVAGAGLVLCYAVFAPLAEGQPPKKPAAKPGPRPARARPGPHKRPAARAKHPRPHGKPKRYVRRQRYWHPVYRQKRPKKWWVDLGYRYYVGGTSYVTVPTPTPRVVHIEPPGPAPVEPVEPAQPAETVAAPDAEAAADEALDTYLELQELVELVHEWRTMNESPALHERLASAGASEDARETLAEIREQNQEFDEQTRAAMRKLARGESAESELESAREELEELIEEVESLAPSRSEGFGPPAGDPATP